MSEIEIVIPNNQNTVDIDVPAEQEETEVQAPEQENNTTYNVGGDPYYSDLAKDWAIKMTSKVLGEDYSSKYYAQQAKEAAERELDLVQGSASVDVIKTGGSIILKTKTYTHTQVIASNEWTINHNMEKRPSVTAVDSSGRTWHPPVKYIDDNNCIAFFLGATTGQAYCN